MMEISKVKDKYPQSSCVCSYYIDDVDYIPAILCIISLQACSYHPAYYTVKLLTSIYTYISNLGMFSIKANKAC
jgi:hypothetical protein